MLRLTERTGVVVIRVWIERPDGANAFRARITLVGDLENEQTRTAAAASTNEIVEIVRDFLDEFVAAR
jgi:hypothetical protein